MARTAASKRRGIDVREASRSAILPYNRLQLEFCSPSGGCLIVLEIEAVYERGALKLPDELPLQEGHKVTITIRMLESAVERLYGMLKWNGNREDLDYLLG